MVYFILDPNCNTLLDLQWEMGNYYQSFYRMLEFSVNPVAQESTIMSNCGPFLDPTVGFYCQMLATKNSMRNAVGEQNSAILLRWATLMTVTSLKRCGNPVSHFLHIKQLFEFYNCT